MRLYRVDSHSNAWTAFETLNGHTDLVTDVSWAPNLGRSYELLATACRDGHVRIFRIKETDATATETESGSGAVKESSGKYRVDCIGDFTDHDAPVWRVHWNVTVYCPL